MDLDAEPHDTDVYTLLVERIVAVTPLTLDMTARIPLHELDHFPHSR